MKIPYDPKLAAQLKREIDAQQRVDEQHQQRGTDDPLPCPFCGSTFIFYRTLEQARCRDCGAKGPDTDYGTFEDMDYKEAWNKRVDAGRAE